MTSPDVTTVSLLKALRKTHTDTLCDFQGQTPIKDKTGLFYDSTSEGQRLFPTCLTDAHVHSQRRKRTQYRSV